MPHSLPLVQTLFLSHTLVVSFSRCIVFCLPVTRSLLSPTILLSVSHSLSLSQHSLPLCLPLVASLTAHVASLTCCLSHLLYLSHTLTRDCSPPLTRSLSHSLFLLALASHSFTPPLVASHTSCLSHSFYPSDTRFVSLTQIHSCPPLVQTHTFSVSLPVPPSHSFSLSLVVCPTSWPLRSHSFYPHSLFLLLTPSLSFTRCLSHSLPLSLVLSLTRFVYSLTHIHSCPPPHTRYLSHSLFLLLTPSLFHSLSLSHSLSYTQSHSLSLSHYDCMNRSLSLALSHSHSSRGLSHSFHPSLAVCLTHSLVSPPCLSRSCSLSHSLFLLLTPYLISLCVFTYSLSFTHTLVTSDAHSSSLTHTRCLFLTIVFCLTRSLSPTILLSVSHSLSLSHSLPLSLVVFLTRHSLVFSPSHAFSVSPSRLFLLPSHSTSHSLMRHPGHSEAVSRQFGSDRI